MIHWSHYLDDSSVLQMLQESSLIALSFVKFFRFNFLIHIREVCCLLSVWSQRHLHCGLTLDKIRMYKLSSAQNKGSPFNSLFAFQNCALFHEVKDILESLRGELSLGFLIFFGRCLFHSLVMLIHISAFPNSGRLPIIISCIYTQLWCFFQRSKTFRFTL